MPVNGVSEQSKSSKPEHCGASERCERTNVASERPSGPFKTRLFMTRNAPSRFQQLQSEARKTRLTPPITFFHDYHPDLDASSIGVNKLYDLELPHYVFQGA